LMTGFTSPNDGYVRWGFPGGWEGDAVNKFYADGRSKKENNVFNYIKTLANYRKKSAALTKGKFMQYLPVDGVYVYFRYTDKETVMCVMNTNKTGSKFSFDRFKERTGKCVKAKQVITGEVISLANELELAPYSNLVLELIP
jgi:glycosidase